MNLDRTASHWAPLDSLGVITHETIVGKITSALREAILSGNLPPGTRLVERDLAKTLDVSRAPLRESLRLLQSDGLVDMEPRRGVRVRSLTPRDVEELYELRAALEGLAVEIVIGRAPDEEISALAELVGRAVEDSDEVPVEDDWEFHRALVRLAHNRRLMAAWERIGGEIRLALVRSTPDLFSRDYFEQTHGELLRSLRARDSDAGRAAVAHLREIGSRLARQWDDSDDNRRL